MANRIQMIKYLSDVDQWHYMSTKSNPVDYISKGIDLTKLSTWQLKSGVLEVDAQDPVVKNKNFGQCNHYKDTLKRLKRITSYNKKRKVIAMVLKLFKLKISTIYKTYWLVCDWVVFIIQYKMPVRMFWELDFLYFINIPAQLVLLVEWVSELKLCYDWKKYV